jgi:hypothetical protein
MTLVALVTASGVCEAAVQQADVRCQDAVIPFETSTLERIVGETELVLEEGEEFWKSERPLILVQGWADEVGSRDPYGRFRARVSGLVRLSEQERADHPLLQMTESIVARQDEWRDKAVPHLCSYMPADVDLSRPAYFVAFVPPRAFATSEGNVIDVAAGYWHQNPDNILNALVHEYFHIGYGQLRRHRSEEPLEDAQFYRMLDMVHNEGLAVWIAYRAQSLFPAPDEVDYTLLDNAADVTRLLEALNELLAQTTAMEADQLRRLAWRVGLTDRAYYVVGAHIARIIEAERGSDALIGTLHEGPLAYVTLYNSLVPEERRVRLRQ